METEMFQEKKYMYVYIHTQKKKKKSDGLREVYSLFSLH